MIQQNFFKILFLFVGILLSAQEKTEYPKGILSDGSQNTEVTVYSTSDPERLISFAQTSAPNALIYLTRENLEAENSEEAKSNAYILNQFKLAGFQAYNKEHQKIEFPVQNPEEAHLKYLIKTHKPLGETIQLKTDYAIWDPVPGIKIGSFTLHFYSLMFVIAFVLGYLIMMRMYRIDGVNTDLVEPFAIWTIFGTILGARLGHVFFYERELLSQDIFAVFLPIRTVPEFKFTGFSGLASHGATIMLIFTTLYYSYKIIKKNPFWVFDRLVIVVALGGAFVRIGNFFNSEIIGKPTPQGSPFAILFPQMSKEYGLTVPRYPSQLFEAFGYFLLFWVLWFIYSKTKKKFQLGWIFGFFLTVLFSIRLLVEFLKEPQGKEYLTFGGLNTGQVLSLPFILLGIIILIVSYKFKNKTPDLTSEK